MAATCCPGCVRPGDISLPRPQGQNPRCPTTILLTNTTPKLASACARRGPGRLPCRCNRTDRVRCFNLQYQRLGHGKVVVGRIGTEASDLQILSEDNRAYILGHQNAAGNIGFDDAPSAKPLEMLDLQ